MGLLSACNHIKRPNQYKEDGLRFISMHREEVIKREGGVRLAFSLLVAFACECAGMERISAENDTLPPGPEKYLGRSKSMPRGSG